MIHIENIPAWLRENGHFVLRRGKVPYTRYGIKADPTNPADGCTAAEALAAWQENPGRYDGLGVMIIPPLVGIDLDHVISTEGELAPVAQEILGMVDTYTEKSPSGTGLHLLGLAPDMTVDSRRYLMKNSAGLEVYFEKRYFTFTGESFSGSKVLEIGDAVQRVLDTYMRRSTMPTENALEYPLKQEPDTRTEDEVALDAATVMERMQRGSDWPIIEAQLSGEVFVHGDGTESADDMSLLNRLAFYSCRDARVMDYIYRTSDRYRDKWDRRVSGSATYGEWSIRKAVRDCGVVWEPNYNSGRQLPPLEDAEQNALEWLVEQDAANNRRYSLDDIGAGYLLADWAKPFARFCADANAWFVYQRGVWKKDPGGVAIAAKAKVLSAAVASYASTIEDDQRRKAWLTFAGRWCSYNSRRTYIRDAASVWPVCRSDFDQHPWLFNVVNGTWDLHKMVFKPHDPADMLTKQGDVMYDPAARCERWESFM